MRIALALPSAYHPAMPTLIFWLLVIAVVVFYQLTTKEERRKMIEAYWMFIFLIGTAGFAWQLLEWSGLTR